jgi:predicted ATPase/DNA-binding SARP family transcriptional activator
MVAPRRVEVRLLGRPAVRISEDWTEPPPGRATALLYYLAFHGGWVGRSDLVYLFWPDAPEARARGNLRPLLWRLSNAPYARGLERQHTRVRWPVATDLQAFGEALDAERWHEAWELGRNELMSGFAVAGAPEFEAWLDAERSELRAAARRAGLRAVDALESDDDAAAAAAVAAALHRDDPLDEAATRRYLATLARAGDRTAALAVFDRFRRLLGEEVGVEPEGETVRLAAAIRAGSESATSGAASARAAAYREPASRKAPVIPRQSTRLIGREREVSELTAHILDDACQLLTIVGPGGVGKTRLAIELASRVGPRYAHGARFVDLAATDEAEAVFATVTAAVGAEARPGTDAARSLVEHLRDAAMLLVLDNVEQVTEAALELITEMVAQAPGVTIVTTSRVRLGFRGERVFDLTGLPARARADGSPSEAVTLFCRAALRIRPHADLTPGELRHAQRICELVGGLPLAIELAATWLRILSVAEIEAELASGSEILGAVNGGAPWRHAGMRAVFDHSWSLLRPREQQALRALSVFRGGWTREAGAAVADAGLPVHLALRDASLLSRDAAGRFAWHPLVGQYASERADERPAERDAAQDRHARYYVRLLAERHSAWIGDEGANRLAEVEAEVANIEAACRRALTERDVDLLAEALQGLHWLIIASAHVGLFAQLASEIAAGAEPRSLLRCRAIVCLGAAATWRGVDTVNDAMIADLEEAVEELKRHDMKMEAAYAHRFLGMAHLRLGRVAEARAVWKRAKALHQALGDAEGVTMMLNNLGDTAPTVEEAVAELRAAAEYGLENGALFPAALAFDGLGRTLVRRHGASPKAIAAIEQAIDLTMRTGFPHVEQRGRRQLTEALAASGDLAAARAAIEQASARCDATGEQALPDLLAARALQAWVCWLAGNATCAREAALAALTPPTDLRAVAPRPPSASEALARLVMARLALEQGDTAAAAVELSRARSARARIVVGPGTWHDAQGKEPNALAWTRLLAAECDCALASSRDDDARAAATEALRIAARSEQEPAGTMALVIAASVLAAADDARAAGALVAYVRGHPATPLDALQATERLEAGWCNQVPTRAEPVAADDRSSLHPLDEVLEETIRRL